MKTFLQNLLIVGGIYFIISFLIPTSENTVAELLDAAFFLIFILTILILAFKKEFKFIKKLHNKMPKICNYLKALGTAQIFALFFIMIPGMIDGYNTAQAKYNGSEYDSTNQEYLINAAAAFFIILVLALLWATYENFIKPRLKK